MWWDELPVRRKLARQSDLRNVTGCDCVGDQVAAQVAAQVAKLGGMD